MIVDIINEVYTNLKNNIQTATVLPSYPEEKPIMPCIIVEELDNTADLDTIDSGGEKYNEVSIQISIFTEGSTKVSDARTLRKAVDTIMSGQYKMNRNGASPTPNLMDTNLFRYTLRYSCIIDSNKTIYRR